MHARNGEDLMQKRTGWTALMLTLVLVIGMTLTPALAEKGSFFAPSADDENDENEAVAPSIFHFDDDSAYLGVQIEEDVEHEDGGARITQIVEGSPADEAGLKKGDVVVGFGRDTIRGPVSLTKKIRDREPGESVRITVRRDGRERDFDVELGERSFNRSFNFNFDPEQLEGLAELKNLEMPNVDLEELREALANMNTEFNFDFKELSEMLAETRTLFNDCEDAEDGECKFSYDFRFMSNGPQLGVHLTEVTPELREHLGARDSVGVLVNKIVEESAAEDADLRVGDLIVDVDGEEISSTNDLRRALGERGGETFSIEVVRDGRSMTLSVTLEEVEQKRRFGPRAAVVPHAIAPPHAVVPQHVVVPPHAVVAVAPRVSDKLRVTVPTLHAAPAVVPRVATPRFAAPPAPAVPVRPTMPIRPVVTTIDAGVI
jgi:membrane-associated protease RseP (regulator of RpoE activity)